MLKVQSFSLLQIVGASSQIVSDQAPRPGTLEMATQVKGDGTPALPTAGSFCP